MNSFRRFVKTTISNTYNSDYAGWFLGHAHSSYYTVKPEHGAEIYAKCMEHLTFLDYTLLEAKGKSTEAELEQSQKQIQQLKLQMAKMEDSQLKIRGDEVSAASSSRQ